MIKRAIIFVCASTLLVLGFQNCQNVTFATSQDSLSSSGFAANDTYVETDLNTPVEFILNHSSSTTINGLVLSFQSIDSGKSLNGAFVTLDPATFKLKYTPNLGFRGKDIAVATAKDSYGNQVQFNVTVMVGNPVQLLEPALAVRGMGCIQCHAQVASNILTDFGYGNDYYFGQKPATSWWNSGGVYGDHGNSFNTMDLKNSINVLVPKAALPTVAKSSTLSTLADYVRSQFASSANSGTKGVNVLEKSTLYIGAPTESDISSAFSLASSARSAYFKNSDSAVALSGLVDKSTFFMNSGTLACEGDLALRGPLYLNNLNIKSATGCRIYVIGSVFLFGPITYANSDATRNLQITSTKSISLGLGTVKKDGAFCDPTDRYATDTAEYGTSSLTNRYSTFWTVPGQFVRQTTDPKAFGDSVVAEAAAIEKGLGTPLYDAVCRSEGRNVSFERLLLNAPVVHSRYEGDVSGTVIAEYAIMSLGMFKFQFDTVFNSVPILPFLNKKTYLNVQD